MFICDAEKQSVMLSSSYTNIYMHIEVTTERSLKDEHLFPWLAFGVSNPKSPKQNPVEVILDWPKCFVF